MTRYGLAVDLIRALDQHRLLSRVGMSTDTDKLRVAAAHFWYGRVSGRGQAKN